MSRTRAGAVAAGLVALASYTFLKAAWGMGSDVGIANRSEFDSVFGRLTSTQVWLATWGTVVLAGAGAVLLLVVAVGTRTFLGRPPLRASARATAWTIAVLLGGYAVAALVATVADQEPSPFAPWVIYTTYGSFLVYAWALGYICWTTRRTSRVSTHR